jgi:hypothetical protein
MDFDGLYALERTVRNSVARVSGILYKRIEYLFGNILSPYWMVHLFTKGFQFCTGIPYTDFPLDQIRLYACWDAEHCAIMLAGDYLAARRAL